MKQISVQVPDYIWDAVEEFSIATGQSKSSVCAVWIDQGLVREIKKAQLLKKVVELLRDDEL